MKKIRMECLERNEFNCDDYHCIYYYICQEDMKEAWKDVYENIKRKKREEEKAIKTILKAFGLK